MTDKTAQEIAEDFAFQKHKKYCGRVLGDQGEPPEFVGDCTCGLTEDLAKQIRRLAAMELKGLGGRIFDAGWNHHLDNVNAKRHSEVFRDMALARAKELEEGK